MKKLQWLRIAAWGLLSLWVALAPTLAASGPSDNDGRVLSKVTFIHFRRAPAKPPWAGGGGKTQEQGYYAYIANGARWRLTEPFTLNPVNSSGMTAGFVQSTVATAMLEWEKYGGEMIFGALSTDYTAHYDDSKTDGLNTVSFGDLDDDNIIAITSVWGYFYGPPKTREIVEADLLFNEFYHWGDADPTPTVMDLLNIAVHEIGHCAGMDDLYVSGAALETMYGTSVEGETIKRDLYTGDITGIKKLYGVK
jgi:hypothetical protein